MAPNVKPISLSDLVKQTADELRKVSELPPPPGKAVMQFQECELELAVTVAGEAEGGIKFWVLTAGTKVSGEKVSRIKLKFTALPKSRIQAQATRKGPAKKPERQ